MEIATKSNYSTIFQAASISKPVTAMVAMGKTADALDGSCRVAWLKSSFLYIIRAAFQ
jgi:hypothetical protein